MATVMNFSGDMLAPSRNRDLNKLPNPALLQLSQSGNTDAAHCLIARYQPLIHSIARRLATNPSDAADLVSEAYLRIYEVINTCRNIETLPGWIKKITVNVFNRLWQKNHRTQGVSLDYLMEVAGDTMMPSTDENPATMVMNEWEEKERERRMASGLLSLSQPYREIVEMFYQKGMSYEDIASQTGLSLGTVKSRLFRAREALQRKLGDLIA